MQADELDARARLRLHARCLVTDLRRLGFSADQLRGRSIVELDELKCRALRSLMETREPERAA